MRKARLHAGLKQQELADLAGVSRASIENYEGDKRVPRRPVLLAWAMATGVALAWLLGDAEVADRKVSAASPDGGRHFLSKMIPCPGSILRTSISTWANYPDRDLPVAA